MEEEDPQSQALRNPIILQQIFKNVPRSGKTLRLVSHFWNYITLFLPHPKLTLRLHRGQCCSAIPFQLFCLKMEPRLSRSIAERVVERECDHPHAQLIASSESKLLHISGQFGPLIENFTVTCDHADFIPTLYELLENFFQNLKRLEIKYESELENAEIIDQDRQLCTMQKLSSIKIVDATDHPGIVRGTQWLLNCAPNLTHFNHHGTLLPDLGRNRSIKILDLNMNCMRIWDLQTDDHIRKVNKILDEVKDCVEFLYLRITYRFSLNAAPIDLNIPKMKNLKEFENFMLDLLGCGDKLQNICTARVPTLQTLRISTCTHERSLTTLVRNIIKEKDLFSGVKNLHVANLHDPELITGLKTPFPNLEMLSINQWDYDACPLIKMEPYLRAYTSLGLKYLEMHLSPAYRENFSNFIQGFSNCGKLLFGLKALKILVYSTDKQFTEVDDLVDDEMQRWLLRMKGLEDVTITGIKFKTETWKWVKSFIQENKIPIVFKKY